MSNNVGSLRLLVVLGGLYNAGRTRVAITEKKGRKT